MSATGRNRHRHTPRGSRAHEQLLAEQARVASTAVADGYNDRENERARRMRTYIGSCARCASPIYEDPGYCVQCAWDDAR